jgi:chemotaxis protein methyltransferase CheR
MTEQDYAFVAKLLQERCAIVLEPGKQYLLDSRLTPVARKYGLASVADFVRRLRTAPDNGLLTDLVEAMVTTETSFFRDLHPFETLRKTIIPELIRTRATEKRLNIWCAASATGQEPYTVAILLKESFPELAAWKVNFIATDISEEMLRRSKEARYSQIEVNRGLPIALLMKYFDQQGRYWQLHDDVRRMVEFRQLNLAQPWAPMPPMDLVLMRNVMIYFDVETKKSILGRMAKVLRPDGYLLLGMAETTVFLDDAFERVEELKSGFYRLVRK